MRTGIWSVFRKKWVSGQTSRRMTSAHRTVAPANAWRLADSIGQAHALFSNAVGEAVRDSGLTVKEAIALWIVDQHEGELTQTEWGRLQGVTRQRAHVIAKRLEQKGLVKVERQGRDSQVHTLPMGRKLVELNKEVVGDVLADVLDGMPRGDVRRLQGLLTQVIAQLSRSQVSPGNKSRA